MAISLEKTTQSVLDRLNKTAKKTLPPCDVALAIDVSGSMSRMYSDGTITETVQQLLAFANVVDPDKKLDVIGFSTQTKQFDDLPVTEFDSVQKHIKAITSWSGAFGGTNYSQALTLACASPQQSPSPSTGFMSRLFGAKPTPQPIVEQKNKIVFFITDGECFDEQQSRDVLMSVKNTHTHVYFQFVWLGSDTPHPFLQSIASDLPNAGVIAFRAIGQLSDDQIYDKILTEELVGYF